MTVSIDIVPQCDSLDFYGEADESSSYSLSGHVSVSLSATSSLFERRRTLRLLLQSLVVSFEGQSELVTPEGGYSPLRLCAYTRELAPNEPIELSNEGFEEATCMWNVVFDIPISGWLPPTSLFGDASVEEGGIRYALHATAKFLNMDDINGKIWSFSTLCSPFRSKMSLVKALPCPITVRRFTNPPDVPSSSSSIFPMAIYAVTAQSSNPAAPEDSTSIPLDVLSKIQVLAAVPQYIDIEDTAGVPLSIRVRAEGLEETEAIRFQVSGFSVEMEQLEKYRFASSSEHSSRYPIPPVSSQPPELPLINPHSLNTLFDLGLVPMIQPPRLATRSFSLNPSDQLGQYKLPSDSHIFAKDAQDATWSSWYTMATTVPFVRQCTSRERNWAGDHTLRVSIDSPHLTVSHKLHIAMTCSYDGLNTAEPLLEKLHFTLPLHFVHVAPAAILQSLPSSSTDSNLPEMVPSSAASLAPSLPAYSQLFDVNGERKIDYSVPLPLYTPRSPPSSEMHEDNAVIEKFVLKQLDHGAVGPVMSPPVS